MTIGQAGNVDPPVNLLHHIFLSYERQNTSTSPAQAGFLRRPERASPFLSFKNDDLALEDVQGHFILAEFHPPKLVHTLLSPFLKKGTITRSIQDILPERCKVVWALAVPALLSLSLVVSVFIGSLRVPNGQHGIRGQLFLLYNIHFVTYLI